MKVGAAVALAVGDRFGQKSADGFGEVAAVFGVGDCLDGGFAVGGEAYGDQFAWWPWSGRHV